MGNKDLRDDFVHMEMSESIRANFKDRRSLAHAVGETIGA
jgi:hypothetical protein